MGGDRRGGRALGRATRHAFVRSAQVLFWVLPRGPHVVVHGFPSTDGSAAETVEALSRRYPGPVVWLDGPKQPVSTGDRTRVLAMNSPAGLLAFLTARATFFTHGLYWSLRPPRRKPLIDLWHGDGPKSHSGIPIASTFEVSGSAVFGAYRSDFHEVPRENLLLTGNPRITQLARPTTPHQLVGLGIDPERPFVVHMPTYRRSQSADGETEWADFTRTDPTETLRGRTAELSAELRRQGVQLVVKPHPLDAAEFADGVFATVTEAALVRVGTTTHSLLGASAGLVTDYSSVWTDYLALDRPIAFLIPDHHEYGQARGLHPEDVLDALPGPVLADQHDARSFAGEVVDGGHGTAALRSRAIRRFGLVHPESPADELLDALAARGVLRGITRRELPADGTRSAEAGARHAARH
jgi:CDP-glycerol glycerophosphotransferase